VNDFIPAVLWLASVGCPLAAILFVARVLAALVSTKVSEQIRRHPVFHAMWGCLAFLGFLFVCSILSPDMWPPISVERREQRARIMERVQSAGGWDALRHACIQLAGQHTNGFGWPWHDTNGLPDSIAALKPRRVEYLPIHGCVRIKVFGAHSTGGHSRPYFGLEVDTTTNNVGYKHGTGYDGGGVIGNHHSVANQVAPGMYEIY
jgi:hypothetical protein